jgi:hypothetical protein
MTQIERIAPLGPACRITQRPAPPVERAPLSLTSRNGKALPLRAIPFRDLNREYWSQGKVLNTDALERNQSRELMAHEKPVEAMTLDELIATADREPLSESRRSWLTRGLGVMSLQPWDAYEEGSIGATVADPTAQAALEAIVTTDPEEADAILDDANDRRYGTAYEGLDPITAKQIEWEQEQHGMGTVYRCHFTNKPDGGIALQTQPTMWHTEVARITRSVRDTVVSLAGPGRIESLDDLDARMANARDAMDALGGDPEFASRYLAPADDEWHSSYDRIVNVVAHDGTNTPARVPCTRCDREFDHRHTRITRTNHRTTRRNNDELWHRRLFDVTAYELGTDGLVDPLVEAI